MTKSHSAVPGSAVGAVSTVKIEGSAWSNDTALITYHQKGHRKDERLNQLRIIHPTARLFINNPIKARVFSSRLVRRLFDTAT